MSLTEHRAEAETVTRLSRIFLDTSLTLAVAVTGARGLDGQDGEPPGAVWCAVLSPTRKVAVLDGFEGEPAAICEQACARALVLVESCVAPDDGHARGSISSGGGSGSGMSATTTSSE